MINAMLASIATVVGTALIYSSWRRWLGPRTIINFGGWLLIAISAMLWSVAAGWEYGTVYFITALPLIAWIFVSWQVSVRPSNNSAPNPQPIRLASFNLASGQRLARHAGLFLLAVPMAGFASALLSIFLTSLLPWQEVDRLALISLLMPTLWGLLMFWSCTDPKVIRPTAAILITGLVAGAAQLG